ncbi:MULTISPECIES: hypothetical protein [unclassified Streptomyces]
MELTDLDTLIDELDERVTGTELPEVQDSYSQVCTILVCDSVACGSVAIC